jgi:hypothetical protein
MLRVQKEFDTMSIYYNPHLLRLVTEERIQEIMRGRSPRQAEDRPVRIARRHATRLSDDCLVRASSLGAGC